MQTTQEHSKISNFVEPKSSQVIEIDRKFNVPVSQLFGAFTTPDAIKVWWWPKGLYTDRVELNFREGGTYKMVFRQKCTKTAF